MTEAEAKTKWCPFARTIISDGADDCGPHNRFGIGEPDDSGWDSVEFRCIASACMAWRWHAMAQGHCGLAGSGGTDL